MSDFDDLTDMVLTLYNEVAGLKRDLANAVKVGTVCDVDGEKGYRLEFVSGKKTAWLPFPEQGADSTSWVPLAKGQVMGFFTPPGDTRQGFVVRGGFCDQYKQPSKKLDEDVFERDKTRAEVRKEDFKLTSPTIYRIADKTDDAKIEQHRVQAKTKTQHQVRGTQWHLWSKESILEEAMLSITLMAPSISLILKSPPLRPALFKDAADETVIGNADILSGGLSGLTDKLSGFLPSGVLSQITAVTDQIKGFADQLMSLPVIGQLPVVQDIAGQVGSLTSTLNGIANAPASMLGNLSGVADVASMLGNVSDASSIVTNFMQSSLGASLPIDISHISNMSVTEARTTLINAAMGAF